MLESFSKIILDLIYPKFCFLCGEIGSYLCQSCLLHIPLNLTQRCLVCQKPSLDGFTHPVCCSSWAPERLWTMYAYQTAPIADMIITGKYQFIPEIYEVLGSALGKHLPNAAGFSACPIPLSNKRKRWRGFNQSAIITKSVCNTLVLPYTEPLLRPKHTKTQKDLSRHQRLQNMSHAFTVDFLEPLPEKLMLIDDVSTTGTTFLEASKILKKSGVKTIWCVAIAQD